MQQPENVKDPLLPQGGVVYPQIGQPQPASNQPYQQQVYQVPPQHQQVQFTSTTTTFSKRSEKKQNWCFPAMICGLVCFVVFFVLFILFFVFAIKMETSGLNNDIGGQLNTSYANDTGVTFNKGYVAADITTKAVACVVGVAIVVLGIGMVVCSLQKKSKLVFSCSFLQICLISTFFVLAFSVQLIISIYLVVWMTYVGRLIFQGGSSPESFGIQLFLLLLTEFFPGVYILFSFIFLLCILCYVIPFCICTCVFCVGEKSVMEANKNVSIQAEE